MTLTFVGDQTRGAGALLDGNYQLYVDPTKVHRVGTDIDLDGDGDGESGGAFVFGDEAADDFFALYGDFDGNRTVNVIDLLRLRASFGTEDGDEDYDPLVDYHADAAVNVVDLLQFRNRFRDRLSFE